MKLHIVIDHRDLAHDIVFPEVFARRLSRIAEAIEVGETKGEEHMTLEQGSVDMRWWLGKSTRVRIFPTAYAVQDREAQSGYIIMSSFAEAAEYVDLHAATTPWVWKVAVVPFEELVYAPATLKPKES